METVVKDAKTGLSGFEAAALCVGRAVLWLVAGVVGWFALARVAKRFITLPAPAFIGGLLDTPFRRALQPPEEVLAPMGVAPGMTVLEVGPGPGTYTIEAARRASPGGRVIAVDLQQGMVDRLCRKIRRLGVTGIEPRLADAYHLPLPDESVDVAFMVTALAEIPDPRRALVEVGRVLRPGGVLGVSEFFPDPDYPRRKTVRRWALDAGFLPRSEDGGWLWYVLTFSKPGHSGG